MVGVGKLESALTYLICHVCVDCVKYYLGSAYRPSQHKAVLLEKFFQGFPLFCGPIRNCSTIIGLQYLVKLLHALLRFTMDESQSSLPQESLGQVIKNQCFE